MNNSPVRLQKKVSHMNRMELWVLKNAPIILPILIIALIIMIILLIIAVAQVFAVPVTVESGNYYYHLKDVI